MVLRDTLPLHPALHRRYGELLVRRRKRPSGSGHAAKLGDHVCSDVSVIGHAYIYAWRVSVVNVESVGVVRVSMPPIVMGGDGLVDNWY